LRGRKPPPFPPIPTTAKPSPHRPLPTLELPLPQHAQPHINSGDRARGARRTPHSTSRMAVAKPAAMRLIRDSRAFHMATTPTSVSTSSSGRWAECLMTETRRDADAGVSRTAFNDFAFRARKLRQDSGETPLRIRDANANTTESPMVFECQGVPVGTNHRRCALVRLPSLCVQLCGSVALFLRSIISLYVSV
jgi:hypothetical protein